MGCLLDRAFNKSGVVGGTVQNYYEAAKQLLGTDDSDAMNFTALLKELKSILDIVKDNEAKFYGELQVNDLTGLNIKLQNIDTKYEAFLSGGKAYWDIYKQIDFNSIRDAATPEELAEALQDYFTEFFSSEAGRAALEELIREELEGEEGVVNEQATHDFLQKFLRGKVNEKGAERFILSRKIKNGKGTIIVSVGLGKIIKGYDASKGVFIIDTNNLDISSGFKKKLLDLLDSIREKALQKSGSLVGPKTNVNFFSSDDEYRNKINEIALGAVSDPDAKARLKRVMERKNEFDLMRNTASVTGYLGEVRAVAIMEELMPNKSVRGTGKLRSVETGSEIPIDVVCEEYGFQVKNYRMYKDQNIVEFSKKMHLPEMLSGRMQFSGSIYDILIDIFGAYQYNQPFTKKSVTDAEGNVTPVNKDTLKQYKLLYNAIANGQKSLFYRLKPVFDTRVPQMLKIVDFFSVAEDQSFLNETFYFNTFYWINKYLVPSSYILKQVIDSLESKVEKYVTTSYSLSQAVKGTSLQASPNLVGESSQKAANLLSMKYTINIDLSQIKII